MLPTEAQLIQQAYAENRKAITSSIHRKATAYKASAVRAKIRGDMATAQTFLNLSVVLKELCE